MRHARWRIVERAGKAAAYIRLTRTVAQLAPTPLARAQTWWSAARLWPLRALRSEGRPCRIGLHVDGARVELAVMHPDDLGTVREVFAERAYASPVDGQARTVVDLGANIGAATRYFRARHPEARILAVEPDPRALELLRRNVGGLAGVVIDPVAVGGNSAAPAHLHLSAATIGSSLHAPRDRGAVRRIPVRTVPLDDLLAGHGVEHVDLLKIDIEGAEYDVLRTFDGLRHVDAIVGEFHERPGGPTPEQFFDLLGDFEVERHAEGHLHAFRGRRR